MHESRLFYRRFCFLHLAPAEVKSSTGNFPVSHLIHGLK
jgi:hypothetical protein